MEITKLGLTVFIVFLISIQGINSTKDDNTTQLEEKSKPLEKIILKENEPGDVNHKEDHRDDVTRVKRQYYDPYYDPYYRRREVLVDVDSDVDSEAVASVVEDLGAEDSVVEDLADLEDAEDSVDLGVEEAEDKLFPLVNKFILNRLLFFIDF
ncbi:unnamed protein product [Spodoptera littoralis]|uniref:Uncharacterized protein n=1 Tax=Spodoptera littoralis TaxID=7109 RepID=A0A9P0IF59_SPOLI|nr:unnamed protein product [Spodoptera littoralis]CAH1645599.1 unnamed protein product [Spodoptera littoralis]